MVKFAVNLGLIEPCGIVPKSWQPHATLWPGVCLEGSMNAIVFKVNGKSGEYVTAAVVPANHSEEARLGWADGVIVGVFLACIGGLICLLVAG